MNAAERIGPYELTEVLGSGGMGVVYRAVHAGTGVTVALKTMLAEDQATAQSMRREARALARLRHPGVVRIVDHGVEAGRPWCAMELLPGRSLRAHFDDAGVSDAGPGEPTVAARRDDLSSGLAPTVRSGSSPGADQPTTGAAVGPGTDPAGRSRRLGLLRKLCAPLSFLHGEGIVHRDLKPDNVLVKPDGAVVIIDFGLATQFDGRLRLALQQAGRQIEGTCAYMAPEMIRGEIADARADLYALGCMLYEALVGHPPFLGTSTRVLRAHLSQEPRPLESLAPELPPGLHRLVHRLLRKSPRERMGYADDVAAALADCGAEIDPEPQRPPRPRGYVYRADLAGREGPQAELNERTRRLTSGEGGLVLLEGESGVGKTRLLSEAVRQATGLGVTTLSGECHGRRGNPLEALAKPLREVADLCRSAGAQAIEQVLGARGHLLAPYVPELLSLPGLTEHPVPRALAPLQARARLFRALTEVFTALSQRAPVLLVLDDLQWADELTLGFLGHLLHEGAVEKTSLLLLGGVRAEERTAELERLVASGARQLELGRLSAAAVTTMVSDMLALDEPSPDFGATLHHLAGGNPFFVAEYLRLAVSDGVVARDPAGFWRLPRGSEALPGLPGSVADVVQRRLDRLSAEAIELVAAVAVAGKDSALSLVRVLTELEGGAFHRAESELLRSHIVEETRPGVIRFQHDKLREQAYSRLEQPRRSALHLRAAAAIEADCAEDAGGVGPGRELRRERAAELATHYELGGDATTAVACHRLAASHAAQALALAESVRHYERAIALAEPATDETLPLLVDLHLEIYQPLMQLQSAASEHSLRRSLRARPLALRLADNDRLAQLEANLSGCYFARADYERCAEHGRASLEYASRMGSVTRRANGAFILTVVCVQTGRNREVLTLAPPIIEAIERTGTPAQHFGATYPPLVSLAGSLGWAHCMLGDRVAALPWLRRALEVATAADHRYALSLAHVMWAWALIPYGDLAGCREHGAAAHRISAEARLPGPELFGAYAMGASLVLDGRSADAITWLERALETSERLGYAAFRSEAHWGLAQATLQLGDLARTRDRCERALAFAEETGERRLVPEFHRLMGEAVANEDPEAARVHLQTGLDACDLVDAPVFAPRALVALGALERRLGRPEVAQAHLLRARDAAERIGLTDDKERARRLLAAPDGR
ncbi:MAG: protein kinase [Myxococcus sp.]|nr:protein kinase [Myxococcus sp.]